MILASLAIDSLILLFAGRNRRWIPLALIFALAPFQHDMSIGGPLRFSIAEINLMLTSILFVVFGRPLRYGPVGIPVALYLGVSLLSSFLNWRPSTLTSLVQMVLYMVVAVIVFASFGKDEEDFRPALYGLLAVGLILAGAVIIFRSGYVLKLHKNGVGGSLAAAVIVCGELWFAAKTPKQRMRFSIILVILSAGLFFSLSRGAWLGAFCGLTFILAMRRQFKLLFRASFFLIPVIAVCWQLLPAQSKSYTTGLSKDNWNIKLRYESLYFARAQFEKEPILGVGVGLRKEYDATNVFWLTLAETGILGITTFLGLHVAVIAMVWNTQKRLKRDKMLYSIVVLGGALIIGKLIHGMVDHYWSRGAIMVAWAGVGMATYGHFAVRRQMRVARAQARIDALMDAQTV